MPQDTAPVRHITPPNRLKAKLGNSLRAFDANAIARAEAAMEAMSGNFAEWLSEELAKLEAAHKATLAPNAGEEELGVFYRCAHDLKGLGTTYGYPIISEFADSLCRLLDSPEARARAPRAVLQGHISAIVAAVHQKIMTDAHPVGRALLTELREQVSRFSNAA
jgi:chemotaxis protein histidine kinase CheA